MAQQTVHRLAWLVALLVAYTSQEQTRWSRQISSYTSDISDWVPLPGPVEREAPKEKEPLVLPPIKRQAVAEPRILTEPFPGFARPTGFGQDFPPRNYLNSPANRQLYLQSVPSAPQNYLTDAGFGQSIRFGLSQPNFPLNQGFISPQFAFDGIPPGPPGPPPKPQTRPQPPTLQNPIKFDNFAKIPPNQARPIINHIGQTSHIIGQPPSHISQSPSFIGQGGSHISQVPKAKPEGSKVIDGYRVENFTNDFTYRKKPVQSLQKIKFENFDKAPKVETISSKPKVEREEVQLLYVPVESLNRGQFNFRSPISSPQLVNTDLYSQSLPKPNPLKQPFSSELPKPPVKPTNTFSAGQEYFSNFDALKDDQVPKYSTIASPFPTLSPTTPKPKKLKPHQPPLAIFLTQEARKGNQIKVGDVLSSLKNADTIAVLDTVNPLNAPKVFIGPSSLKPPENYVRFELPYLSNIENTDKKKLPFFVAPLSYNTPQGFAKIPFPSPHVGSVVINSQIKEPNPSPVRHSSPPANINLNAYTVNQPEQKPVTQKPSYSYYSTASPKTNAPTPANPPPHYYSFEPQTVTAVPPQKETEHNILTAPPKTGSYFLSNVGDQYNPQYINFQQPANHEPVRDYNVGNKRIQPETTTTLRTTITTSTKTPSTYSSQLLETHNPYSINQAFHFSTPLDYHNYYDDPYAAPGLNQVPKGSPSPVNPPSSQPPRAEVVTEKQNVPQSSPNYVQSYTPEIHYEAEVPNSRYPVYNSNEYSTKPEVSSENYQTVNPPSFEAAQPADNQKYHVGSHETVEYTPHYENLTETIINKITSPSDEPPKQVYDQYEESYESNVDQQSSTTSTTTTTTRRTPLRTRGRPKYTTTPRSAESTDSTTRSPITRRPLRERRPLPPRSRYEPNKITTEKATRKPLEPVESTTKSSRTRIRGRVQYKPSESDEHFNKRNKGHGTKEEDLAYQRDVLHQNYPVTLMERMSTVDIEAITEPTQRLSSAGENYDTEQAYAHDSVSSLSYPESTGPKEDTPVYSTGEEYQTEATYVSKHPSTQSEEYYYQTRSSAAPVQALSEEAVEQQEDKPKQTTTGQRESVSFVTEPTSSTAEQSQPNYSVVNEYSITKQEEPETSQDIEITKVGSQEHETETEENIVQTTPSYNRVRVRPGVIRQYHQTSSTERSRPERRKPSTQAITYRPAFDRRRTTMRIEEIEADLKTKQVHSRPEVQDYKHPVYKPEPTTEAPVTTASSVDTNKKGHFRRRRPVYTTTSTEATSSRKSTYEVKNRFRGRRPTEKPTDKPETQTESTTTTVRSTPFRFSHRPRLSERYNRKPEPDADETEDQDSNYSINRPKYAAPEYEQWSPKISGDSFKPYNPNDIVEDVKSATTEHKDEDNKDEGDLDIITARNDYDDILISVTPATNNPNNRGTKKLSDIPPTLEAFVDQRKTTKSDSTDTMSTFETMLEEVMKSLEEQDEDEYTSKVMKHKGGEIGEIPPERIISSGDEVTQKTTAVEEVITTAPGDDYSANPNKDQKKEKGRRRGYWKKVKVRPVATEAIETAESQYYTSTVNRLGESVTKLGHEKVNKFEKPKVSVTTYKPNYNFIKDFFEGDEEFPEDVLPTIDIPKIDKQAIPDSQAVETDNIREFEVKTEKATSPGDFDLGTGSPDPTLMDSMYFSTPTEPTSSETVLSLIDRSSGFNFMDYLFGVTEEKQVQKKNETRATTKADIEISTEHMKPKMTTTESTYIPEEITAVTDDNTETVTEFIDIKKMAAEDTSPLDANTQTVNFETASESSFMNPANVVSTSMSTEISHETEICFRGKCIKTNKDLL